MDRHTLIVTRALPLLLAAVATGCGPSAGTGEGTTAAKIDVPDRVTDETYADSLRTMHTLPLGAPERFELRERIVEHLATDTEALLDTGNYEEVLAHFEEIADLYRPEDFEGGKLPRALEGPARFVLDRASARGDEAHAMAALFVLDQLDDDTDGYAREYERVVQWGREARSTLPSGLASYTQLIDVWQRHAELTPAPEVLDTLAKLHVERRNLIVRAVQSGEGLFGPGGGRALRALGAPPQQLLQRAPFDVAAVYLQHGDLASAITHVEAMGDAGGLMGGGGGRSTESQLVQVLRQAREGGGAGFDAVAEIAEAYREARPEVAVGLCRYGLRQAADDARFPACLARVAAAKERFGDATAWYAEAIDRSPGERRLYDEALQQLNRFIEEGLYDSDPSGARRLAKKAQRILEQRLARWPESEPPVEMAELHLLVGMLEMNAGNAEIARERLEKSLQADPKNPKVLLQLGLLEERTGHPDQAAKLYRKALDLTPQHSPRDAMKRAEILEHIGDAFRESGDTDGSRRMYRQALDLWDETLSSLGDDLQGPALSLVQVRRGVLHDRLEQHEKAVPAFRAAMAAGAHWRETYASILSHLVVVAPDPELALEVFRKAQRQLTLEPEWKVYFALWVTSITGRAGKAPPGEVKELLERLADSGEWWGRLAKFGLGELPYRELLAEATGLGQKTEAHFYEGARRLSSGDAAGAKSLFERVLSTHMVSFYEFAMAQELMPE